MAWRNLESRRVPRTEPLRAPEGAVFGLRVLASGSSGNATLVYVPSETPGRPTWLGMIDAGISPARVRSILAEDGLDLLRIDDVLYTHLDRDHASFTWSKLRACRARRWIHRRHVNRAQRDGHAFRKLDVFNEAFEPTPDVRIETALSAHDQLGVAVFRIEFTLPTGAASLGFATDVGKLEQDWLSLVSNVDVLAIESNYCPDLQIASPRPEMLKRRIMGGAGHLSNAESAEAVRVAAPSQHAVLLHPSRQCNSDERVLQSHAHHGVPVTITRQTEPTPWVWAMPSPAGTPRRRVVDAIGPQHMLFRSHGEREPKA